MWKNICKATTLTGRRCRKKRVCDNFCKIHNPDYKKPEYICSICLDEITDKINLYECGHEFCKTCIYTWLCKCTYYNCPFCRTFISDINLKNNASKYGILNGLMVIISIRLFNINNISINEYDLIKPYIRDYENIYLTSLSFSMIRKSLIDNNFFEIYYRLTKNFYTTRQYMQIQPDLTTSENEYFFIINEN